MCVRHVSSGQRCNRGLPVRFFPPPVSFSTWQPPVSPDLVKANVRCVFITKGGKRLKTKKCLHYVFCLVQIWEPLTLY